MTRFLVLQACFYFHLKAANGEIVLASESYTSKQSAQTGIASVKKNVADSKAFNKLVAKDKQFYFTLEALNGETIGVSETYTTASSRDAGIDAVTRNALLADTVDETTGGCAPRLSQARETRSARLLFVSVRRVPVLSRPKRR